jgi:hypothetical protein
MKITYLGRRIDGQYERRSWLKRTWCLFIYKLQRTLRVMGILMLVAWFGLGCLKFGIAYAHGTEISYIAPIAFAQTVPTTPDFQILDKIAKAESQDRQFGPNGQVLIHMNTNSTYDEGYYQINSIWGATAAKMGYNLAVEADNKAFAVWLFENYGSEPWNSSKANWR